MNDHLVAVRVVSVISCSFRIMATSVKSCNNSTVGIS